MSSKTSVIKTVVVLVILVLVGVLGVLGLNTAKTYLSGATAGLEPKNVAVKVDDDSVTISWDSDVASAGYIQYGTTPASLLLSVPSREELSSVANANNHQIVLKTFKPNTTYYFRLRSGTDAVTYTEWEVFDNGGIPYSFKTKAMTGSAEVSPAVTASLSPAPTVSLTPGTPSESTPTSCVMGTDYNNDGVANSVDYRLCLSGGAGGSSVVPTVKAVPTAASSTSGGTCQSGTDYDGNGVVNSLDIVKCRQGTR